MFCSSGMFFLQSMTQKDNGIFAQKKMQNPLLGSASKNAVQK